MYYELYFHPKTGAWRIRIVSVYFLFFPVSEDICVKSEAGPNTVQEFATHDDAMAFADMVGLSKAYLVRTRTNEYASFLATGGVKSAS